MRMDLSSESRAKAFLWLCFNYLESSMPSHPDIYHSDDVVINPFGDPKRGGKPYLVFLNPKQVALENVDPPEEIQLARNLLRIRIEFVRSLESKGKGKQTMPSSASGSLVGADAPGFIREETDVGKLNHDHPFTVKIPRSTLKGKRSTAVTVNQGRKQKAVKSTSTDNETSKSLLLFFHGHSTQLWLSGRERSSTCHGYSESVSTAPTPRFVSRLGGCTARPLSARPHKSTVVVRHLSDCQFEAFASVAIIFGM